MFKKIYFKIACFCIICVISILFLTGFITTIGTAFYYFDNIDKSLSEVSESNLVYNFNIIVNSQADENLKNVSMEDAVSKYYGKLGINENRKLFVIKQSDYSIVAPSKDAGEVISITENLVSGASGNKNKFSLFGDFIDCSKSFKTTDGETYILYIKDNKADLRIKITNNIIFFLWSFIPALLISLLIAFFISRKVTIPVKKITRRAESLERGEINEVVDKIDCEEFKELVDAVNHMGYVMAESIRQMNSDKHKVEVILEHINNGIITFDVNQKPIQINSAAKRILKLKDENILFDEFFNNLGIDIYMADFLYFDKSKTIEKEIKKDDGYIKTWFIPFKMDSERNAGVVCVFEDITEQFNVMAAMRKFVADVSHELKTPITVISSYTETVLNGYLDDKAMATNLLNIVYKEAGKMTELVQNLLDISKYETNAMVTKKEPFSIDDMLLSLTETFKHEAEKKELTLKYNRMTEIPSFVGSRSDLERAVKNIISNSIKYTTRGDKINIFAGKLNNDIYIKVEDTGWGIPENKLGRLFERFYRVEEEARSRDKGGTGLGLSIAKEIIENHNGNIKIESEYTKYTRVTITLPIQ